MRAVDCWYGQLIQGDDDWELMRRRAEQEADAHGGEHEAGPASERVTSRSCEPPTGAPSWAY
jgi:hypothetical protein